MPAAKIFLSIGRTENKQHLVVKELMQEIKRMDIVLQ
jgi:hypothetical protein